MTIYSYKSPGLIWYFVDKWHFCTFLSQFNTLNNGSLRGGKKEASCVCVGCWFMLRLKGVLRKYCSSLRNIRRNRRIPKGSCTIPGAFKTRKLEGKNEGASLIWECKKSPKLVDFNLNQGFKPEIDIPWRGIDLNQRGIVENFKKCCCSCSHTF